MTNSERQQGYERRNSCPAVEIMPLLLKTILHTYLLTLLIASPIHGDLADEQCNSNMLNNYKRINRYFVN